MSDDLSSFVLARIAEDEAPTWQLVPYWCEPGCCAPAGFVGHRCLICGTQEFGGTVEAITEISEEHDESIHRRSRALAEGAAKRKVVHLAQAALDEPDSWFWPPRVHMTGMADGLVLAAQMLALPYADHPDYRDEWKP